jgi:hypothetical protein
VLQELEQADSLRALVDALETTDTWWSEAEPRVHAT